MTSLRSAPWLACLLGVAACGGEAGKQSLDSREAYHYADANPSAPLDDQSRARLLSALAVLGRTAETGDTSFTRDLARHTLARIEAGDVLIGSVPGARGLDRWHMCKDYALPACEGTFSGDDEWMGDASVTALLTAELDGYQWGNRLYFSFRDDTNADGIAATLVHEVNHVLNRSECNYYEDIDAHVVDHTLAYVEEYRAFLTECYFSDDASADVAHCNAHAEQQLLGYEFTPDLTEVLPEGEADSLSLGAHLVGAADDDGYGLMVPTKDAWPVSFAPCSCIGSDRDESGTCRHANGRFAPDRCCS